MPSEISQGPVVFLHCTVGLGAECTVHVLATTLNSVLYYIHEYCHCKFYYGIQMM